MTMNVRGWIHYIDLRTAKGMQKEPREFALGAKAVFAEQFPSIATALGWLS